MSELEDNSPQDTRLNDPFSWLATQNNELRDKNKMLEMELYDWKLNAMEAKERLRRVCQNRNKQNYVDSFYDSNMKKLIKSFSEENVILRKELSKKDVSVLSEQRNTIQALKDKLEIKVQENKLLKNEIENLKSPDAINELKKSCQQLQKNNLKITVEYTNVKNHIKHQRDIMSYLKSEFGKQRKEFIKIFTEYYLQHGEDFIKQLKSLDGGGAVPEFLTKPLQRDISTSTTDDLIDTSIDPSLHAPTTDIPNDAFKDSGIDTLPEEFRELMTKSRELEEAKNRITHLEEECSFKTNEDMRMKTLLTSFSEKNKYLENRTKMLEEELARTQKGLTDARGEALSWKTAIQMFGNESSSHRQSYPFESETQEYRKRMTREREDQKKRVTREREAKEPHQVAQWRTNSQPILVRDFAAKSDSHCPTETQDVSKYSPRGPLSLPPPVTENVDPCFKLLQERRNSTGNELHKSSERKPKFIQCEKCKKDIEVEQFDAHSMHCG